VIETTPGVGYRITKPLPKSDRRLKHRFAALRSSASTRNTAYFCFLFHVKPCSCSSSGRGERCLRLGLSQVAPRVVVGDCLEELLAEHGPHPYGPPPLFELSVLDDVEVGAEQHPVAQLLVGEQHLE
jgi:hypothetical protein